MVAGVPTTIVRPGEGRRWPALVFVNGATARGRHHPEVQRLARALGRAGFLVVVPDLPGLARGELTLATVASAVAVARATLGRPDVRGGRVALFGVSVGTSIALLVAEDPSLAQRVSIVAGLAPYSDLRKVIHLAATGLYPEDGRLLRYRASSALALVVARSLVAGLPEPDRGMLEALLPRVDGAPNDPLARLRTVRVTGLGAEARAVVELLANRDPQHFNRLYAALPPRYRAGLRQLSPIAGAGSLFAPVALASASHDKYFPLAESRALARAAPRVRITVTSALAHAVPRLSLANLAGLISFDAFAVRVMRAASA